MLALAIFCARAIMPAASTTHSAFGSGSPIVLLHGLGSSSDDWVQTARRLARHHRVVLLDLPGHGESNMPEPFSLARAVAALDGALADIPGGPPILVGHSLGGLVAAAEAIDHPSRIRGLVLIETALRPQLPEDQRAEWLARLEHDYAGVVHAAYLDFGRDSTQGELLYRRVAALDPSVVKRWIRLAWSADLSAQAAHLDVSTLAVLAERSWGDHEPWAAVAEGLGYAKLPRLRAARIADCGHFVMLDHPVELAAMIETFASEAEGIKVALR